MELNEVVKGVVLTKACSIKANGDSEESKSITLKVKFDGSTLSDVFNKALGGAVIQWQNGPGRKNFDTWEHKQVVEVDFKAPGRTQVDPEIAMIEKLAGMDTGARVEYIAKMLDKVEG